MVFLSLAFLTHYAMTDSKTALGVLLLVLPLLAMHLYKYVRNKLKYMMSILILIIGYVALMFGIKYFYTGITDYGSASEEKVDSSLEVLLDNFSEWGKIKGYSTLTSMNLETDWVMIFIGNGREKWMSHGIRNKIEEHDISSMSYNNILNSRSAILRLYSDLGLAGILLHFLLFWILISQSFRSTSFYDSKNRLGNTNKIFTLYAVLASVIYMGLYDSGGFNIKNCLAFEFLLLLYVFSYRHQIESCFAQQTS